MEKSEAKDILITGTKKAGNEDETEERILQVESKTAAFCPHSVVSVMNAMHC